MLASGERYFWRVSAVNQIGTRVMDGGTVTFVTAPALDPQVITAGTNADLEQDPINANGWQLQIDKGGATATWDGSVAHDGSHSIRFDADSEDPSDIAIVKAAAADRLPVQPGRLYQVSAWFRGSGVWDPSAPVEQYNRAGNVYVWYYDSAGATIGHRRQSGWPAWAGSTWTQRIYSTAAPAGAVSMGIELRLTGVGTLWVDDLEVRESDPEAMVALTAEAQLVNPSRATGPLKARP